MSSKPTTTLFLAWHPPQVSHVQTQPVTIGRLDYDGTNYTFQYTAGIEETNAPFAGVVEFPNRSTTYSSKSLFPLFANRLMSPSRKDFPESLEKLGLPKGATPMTILGRSAGRKATDRFRVFPYPERTSEGFRAQFFLENSKSNAEMAVVPDKHAMLFHSNDFGLSMTGSQSDMTVQSSNGISMGQIPGYYAREFRSLLKSQHRLDFEILQVNAPSNRWAPNVVLVEVTGQWPEEWTPFESGEYEPLAAKVSPVAQR